MNNDQRYIPVNKERTKSYIFKVVVEQDDDAYFAYCPALESKGAATRGDTREEALANIEEVLRMVVDSLVKHGEPIPESPSEDVEVSYEPRVVVTV